jgi:hypothetical protein
MLFSVPSKCSKPLRPQSHTLKKSFAREHQLNVIVDRDEIGLERFPLNVHRERLLAYRAGSGFGAQFIDPVAQWPE